MIVYKIHNYKLFKVHSTKKKQKKQKPFQLEPCTLQHNTESSPRNKHRSNVGQKEVNS